MIEAQLRVVLRIERPDATGLLAGDRHRIVLDRGTQVRGGDVPSEIPVGIVEAAEEVLGLHPQPRLLLDLADAGRPGGLVRLDDPAGEHPRPVVCGVIAFQEDDRIVEGDDTVGRQRTNVV